MTPLQKRLAALGIIAHQQARDYQKPALDRLAIVADLAQILAQREPEAAGVGRLAQQLGAIVADRDPDAAARALSAIGRRFF